MLILRRTLLVTVLHLCRLCCSDRVLNASIGWCPISGVGIVVLYPSLTSTSASFYGSLFTITSPLYIWDPSQSNFECITSTGSYLEFVSASCKCCLSRAFEHLTCSVLTLLTRIIKSALSIGDLFWLRCFENLTILLLPSFAVVLCIL